MGPRNYVLDEVQVPTGGALLRGHVPAHCDVLHMSALCVVYLPPRVNVPVQQTWRTNALATTKVTE